MTLHGSSAPPLLGRHSPRLRALRALVRQGDSELAVVDGLKLVLEVTRRRVEVDAVYVTPEQLDSEAAEPALVSAKAAGTLFLVDPATMEHVAPTRHPQGVLAVVRIPRRPLPPPSAGTIVYLDRVQDPVNVGAVVRCAAAFGAAGVACSPGSGSPFSPRAIRASAGHTLLLPVATDTDFAEVAAAFTAAGGDIVGAATSGGAAPAEHRPRPPVLLALGSEGRGLSADVAARCTLQLTIPLAAGVESLNVAVTAGVLLAALGGLVRSPILDL